MGHGADTAIEEPKLKALSRINPFQCFIYGPLERLSRETPPLFLLPCVIA